MSKWLSRDEALQLLQVQPQTLYAYVSRGKVGARPDPSHPRRSQFRAEDVSGLVNRRDRGRRTEDIATGTMKFGEPIITTAISTIDGGQLFYRGHNVVVLSAAATIEEVAALLWDAPQAPCFASWQYPSGRQEEAGRTRAFITLARAASGGVPTFGRAANVLRTEAADLVSRLTGAFAAQNHFGGPLHAQLAAAWGLDDEAADRVRQALVLLADQELTSSAFAARVTASTGASLGACMLSGFATLSGPLHGDATVRVRSLFEEVSRTGVERAIERHLSSALSLPGFGHPLYPEGDPRAAAMLASFEPPETVMQMIAKVEAATGLHPTVDVALAALTERYDLPEDAPFALFAIGRSVGWLAHSIEQVASQMTIRPRAKYVGLKLNA